MVLLVLKATDYRIDMAQIVSITAMKRFLTNLQPENIFVCFTHCDESTPDAEFIKEKIASIKQYGKIEVPEENVILFDNSKESLEDFVADIVPGDVHIVDDIEEALEQFDEGLPYIT